MDVMTYKGYTAHIEYSQEEQLLVGHVQGITPHIVGFHGETPEEVRSAFEMAVEDYLQIRSPCGSGFSRDDVSEFTIAIAAGAAPSGLIERPQSRKSDS